MSVYNPDVPNGLCGNCGKGIDTHDSRSADGRRTWYCRVECEHEWLLHDTNIQFNVYRCTKCPMQFSNLRGTPLPENFKTAASATNKVCLTQPLNLRQHENKMNDLALMNAALNRFATEAEKKFHAGIEEHGHKGSIIDRDVLADLECEIIDMWFYSQALRQQRINRQMVPSDFGLGQQLEQANKELADTKYALQLSRGLVEERDKKIDELNRAIGRLTGNA